MPAMFPLTLAPAIRDLQGDRDGGHAFAFLDDACVLASPERAVSLYTCLERYAFQRASLRLNPAKKRFWYAAGIAPAGRSDIAPDGSGWVGDSTFPPQQRGLVALGVPSRGSPPSSSCCLRSQTYR